jgi:guanine deaminase
MAVERTIYVGRFIHCKTLTDLDIFTGNIGVDEHGKIAWVLPYITDGYVDAQPGWEETKTVAIEPEGSSFFFPGFIGKPLADKCITITC